MLQDRLGLSERRACRVAGQHRSTQRHEPQLAPDDAALRARLREISKDKPRWGYRRAHARLIEEGWEVNRKRVQRLWREEGLRVPARKAKRRRLAETPTASAFAPSAPTTSGRSTSMRRNSRRTPVAGAERGRRVHPRGVGERGGALDHRRGHRRPARTPRRPARHRPRAHPLRQRPRADRPRPARLVPPQSDRHRLHRARLALQNPFVESFNGRTRDEVLDVELFFTLAEARVILTDWIAAYNTEHPHSALGMLPPARFAERWREENGTRRLAPVALRAHSAKRRSTPLPCRLIPTTDSH